MLHPHKELLAQILTEINANEHTCCLETAVKAWTQIVAGHKHREFFVQLSGMIFTEKDLPEGVLKLIISALSLGTVCALGSLQNPFTKQRSKEIN